MSSAIRIALVAEGVTDKVVVEAAIQSMLNGQSFILTLLQPEESVAFTGAGNAGPLGGGWKGVYKWCRQATLRGGGRLSSDPLFIYWDLLLVHLDADVAHENPANHPINPIPELAGQLPCEQAFPPPDATTNRLRAIILAWVGENEIPPRTVLCTPSKNTETWVVATFFPNDKEVIRNEWECYLNPENRLAQQKKAQRFTKSRADYEGRKPALQAGWPALTEKLSEAARFQNDFISAVQSLLT